ncbi:uncharacterized protein LOC127709297 [Mytilus californianus]|uniref:uncharacterized protein LOC127709297 n=1 Tax=Mytilus californianus TaxID=6549 RepID=UPI0022472463|nr:uncharacterized protein LOC127709297 [Mytilus californianus]XP_052070723.1 uncharacterized protein LOC127709297 [Mytilus californianus]
MNVDLELILQKATLQPEEVPIFCLCSEKSSNKEWTKIFIKNLKRDGFYNINSNIDFLPGQDYNNTLQNCLRCISKLVIILSPVSDDQFTSVVNTAVSFILNKNLHVDMIPVITSDEVDLPFCLSSVIPFQAWDDDWSKLRLALRKSDPSDKGNARLELFCQVFGKVLHLRIIEMEEELRQKDKIAMDVLRGWGLDIHDDKVNFHINTLLGIGNTQPICLLNLYNSLFHQKQFRFIRICDIKRFDLEGLQINKQLNSDLFEIFEILRKNVCKQSWYHYRRNGIKHNESSELSLNPFKQNNAKKREEGRESICFPKFKTFQSRVDTFEDFPIQVKEFRIKLSRAGFFNLHTSDYVQCFSCGGCIRSWNSDADPMVAHKKILSKLHFHSQ